MFIKYFTQAGSRGGSRRTMLHTYAWQAVADRHRSTQRWMDRQINLCDNKG